MFCVRSGSGHRRAWFRERRRGSLGSRSARHQKTGNADVEVSTRGISHLQNEGALRSGALLEISNETTLTRFYF